MVLFRLKKYLQFLIKSTNQHGVHSPFVYRLVTQCFYDTKKRKAYTILKSTYKEHKVSSLRFKDIKLIHRLVVYFGHKHIFVLDNKNSFIKDVFLINDQTSVHTSLEKRKHFDLIYLDINSETNSEEILKKAKTYNDSLLLIYGISASQQNHNLWKRLIQSKEVSVSINTYHFGFIFFRKEQVKEDFFIRL